MSGRRAEYVQAIRGPILLMTVGALFAVQQSGGLSVGRTWPFLLIAIGVMMLIERVVGGPVVTTPIPQPQPLYGSQPARERQSWPMPGRSWSGQPPAPGPARSTSGSQMPEAQVPRAGTGEPPPPPLPPQTGGSQV